MTTKTAVKSLKELKKKFASMESSLSEEAKLFFAMLMEFVELLVSTKSKANSRNAHVPPSADPFRKKKKKNKIGLDAKKPGGQAGHVGSTLVLVDKPDKIIIHPAKVCSDCGHDLGNLEGHYTRHQVIDVVVKKVVVEHQVEHKICQCGHHEEYELPLGSAPAQYGPGIKAMAVELNQVQCIPFKRCAEFLQQKFDLMSLSPGTIVSFVKEAGDRLFEWEADVKWELLSSTRLHADETGVNINGGLMWVHVLSSATTTLMYPHPRRGLEGMAFGGVLPKYHGILSHDFWAPYGKLDAIHVACHGHLQRELKRVEEDYGQKWAGLLAEILLVANKERQREENGLAYSRICHYERLYDRYLREGFGQNRENKKRAGKRGRIAQSYPRKLLNRLKRYRDWALLFLYDPQIPFTNNQAERDIRMEKVQQKVSGCFRTFEGAASYCRIRSYILTQKKKGLTNDQALKSLFLKRAE